MAVLAPGGRNDGGAARAEDPAFRLFLEGDPPTIDRAQRIARAVVASRGALIPAADRADLVQEALMQVWRALTLERTPFDNDFDGLVCTIACRRCIDWRRRRRASAPVADELASPGGGPEAALLAREERALARQLYDSMRASCRELFRLFHGRELTYREISGLTGRSETALRTQMYECLKTARLMLARTKRGVALFPSRS